MHRPLLIGWPATLLRRALRKRGRRCRPAGLGGGSPRPIVDQTCKCSTYVLWRFFVFSFFFVENATLFLSAASDVNPDHVAGQRVAELACAAEDAVPQTAEQPAAAAVPESAEELPASTRTAASSPTRVEEAMGTPPPSNVAEGEGRAPTPPPVRGREVPTPPRAGVSSTAGSPGLVQGPVMPATTTGGDAAGEETQAASDDEVEEIEGRPRDGRQHVYVWR